MDREAQRRLPDFRLTRASGLENELIDELAAGTIDRRQFLRHGALIRVSVSTEGGILEAFGLNPAKALAAGPREPRATRCVSAAWRGRLARAAAFAVRRGAGGFTLTVE